MDKEKEVKRFGLVRLGKGDIRDLVIQPEGKYVFHSDWQAERTKREEAEKRADHWMNHYYDDTEEGKKVSELEAKVKELEESVAGNICSYCLKHNVDSCPHNPNKREITTEYAGENSCFIDEITTIEKLTSQLATANAKIVELEKNGAELTNCDTWSMYVSSVRKLKYSFSADRVKWKAELDTANKKAEKLVETLEEIKPYFEDRSDCDHNGITFVSNEENKLLGMIEQALKEYKNA